MALAQTASSTVAAYFDNKSDAADAVDQLKSAGFSSAHLGFAHHGDSSTVSGSNKQNEPGVWDKIKDFFEGDEAEPYADERTQGNMANREVTANPANDYTSGYGDDLRYNLSGMNVSEDRSRYFGTRLNSNERGAVVTVKAGDRYDEAIRILTSAGGDIGEGAADYDYGNADTVAATDQKQIQLLGEVLRVQKDRVSRGEVTLRKETITEMQTIQVPVSREELVIERRAVSGTQAADGTIGDGDTIRIPLSEERASLDKSTVVREEVNVGKRTIETVKDLSGEVRHEDLVVEEDGFKNNR